MKFSGIGRIEIPVMTGTIGEFNGELHSNQTKNCHSAAAMTVFKLTMKYQILYNKIADNSYDGRNAVAPKGW